MLLSSFIHVLLFPSSNKLMHLETLLMLLWVKLSITKSTWWHMHYVSLQRQNKIIILMIKITLHKYLKWSTINPSYMALTLLLNSSYLPLCILVIIFHLIRWLIHWALSLWSYKYTIIYELGRIHKNIDVLTRIMYIIFELDSTFFNLTTNTSINDNIQSKIFIIIWLKWS